MFCSSRTDQRPPRNLTRSCRSGTTACHGTHSWRATAPTIRRDTFREGLQDCPIEAGLFFDTLTTAQRRPFRLMPNERPAQDVPPQTPCVRVPDVIDPAPEGRSELRECDPPGAVISPP
jgi:hypothetical protein